MDENDNNIHAMTKYEACEIISNRAMLLSSGSKPLVQTDNKNLIEIAALELYEKKLDVLVVRDKEEIHIEKMQLPDVVKNLCNYAASSSR